MPNLTKEQIKDCQDRITKANAEIKATCEKYEVEVIAQSINIAMGDVRYKGVESPLPLNELVNHETDTQVV